MTKDMFSDRMRELLPHPSEAALSTYTGYAEELDEYGTIRDHEFYDQLYAAFCLVTRRYGPETASTLFDYGERFTFNPFEVTEAARLLSEGRTLDEIGAISVSDSLDVTPEDREACKAILERLKTEDPSYPGMDLSI